MQISKIISSTLVLFLVLVLIYILFVQSERASDHQDKIQMEDTSALSEKGISLQESDENNSVGEAKVTANEVERQDKIKQRRTRTAEIIGKLARASIKDIEFYGVVVDQYLQPVANAQIEYHASGSSLVSGSGMGRTRTDSDGRFRVEDVYGTGFRIDEISKVGYLFSLGNVDQLGENKHEGLQAWKKTSQDAPMEFMGWQKGKDRIFKYTRSRGGYRWIPDGRKVSVTITSPNKDFIYREWGNDKIVEGDFSVSMLKREGLWKATIVSLKGGIIETEPGKGWINIPPATGYRERYEYDYGPQNLKKWYFLKLGNGDYAKLRIGFSTYFGRKGISKGKGKLNIEYSRDLFRPDEVEK